MLLGYLVVIVVVVVEQALLERVVVPPRVRPVLLVPLVVPLVALVRLVPTTLALPVPLVVVEVSSPQPRVLLVALLFKVLLVVVREAV